MLMEGRQSKAHQTLAVDRQATKFRELVIYVSSQCQDDEFFGAVKLNKILFHSDFRAYRRWGKPITGVAYRRLKQGPAPTQMTQVLAELHKQDEVKTQKRLVGGREQKRPIALRPADLELFSGAEIALVDSVIRDLWGKTATTVSNESHGIQWNTRNDKDPMPYESALLSDEPVTPDDVNRATLYYRREKLRAISCKTWRSTKA